MASKLYFQCGIDCEPLADKSPGCGGPASWEISEEVILRWVEIFKDNDLLGGLSFNATPEAAKAHADLFIDLKKQQGIPIEIQPNIPGFRFPTYKLDLGYYDQETQRKIIGEAVEDFQNALGFVPECYLPCCGSKNEHTYPLLVEFGFKVTSAPVAGRYFSDRPDRCTIGMFPFPHWASNHPIIGGCLPLYVVPGTGDFTAIGRDKWTVDLRPERSPTGETLMSYRHIVDMNIEVMKLVNAPVKAIVLGSHNAEYVHFENVQYVLEYLREKASSEEMELVPTSALGLREVAEAIDSTPDLGSQMP